MPSLFPYKVAVGPSVASEPVQEVTDFDAWQLDRNYDDGCTFSFAMPGDSPAARQSSELATDVWLYRGGAPVQRFRMVEVEQEWTDDGDDVASVLCVCYRRILAARHVWDTTLNYVGESQGLILWDFYQHTQGLPGGDMGVTLGDPGPVVPRDRSYVAGENLLELAVNLSEIINGLSFDVTTDLELVVSQPPLGPVRAQPVELGVNASRVRRPSGAAEFANAGIAFGDEEATVPAYAEAADVATDLRGRWERTVTRSSVTEQTTVQEYADAIPEEQRSPAVFWHAQINPERYAIDSNYNVGDFVEFVQPRSTVAPINTPSDTVWCQVLTLSIGTDPDGNLDISINAVEAEPAP